MYVRQTHRGRIDQLSPELQEALGRAQERHSLTLDEASQVWITESENPPSTSFLGKLLGRRENPADPNTHSVGVVILTRTHLVWAVHGDSMDASALVCPLMQVTLEPSPIASEPGVTLSGFASAVGEASSAHASVFVGVGPGEAGVACVQAIRSAVSATR